MSDKEKPLDAKSEDGSSDERLEGMVSMEQLNEAVESAVSQTVEKFAPMLDEASKRQTEILKQSQRDAIKDRVEGSVERALKAKGLSTEAPVSDDSTSEPKPTTKSDNADEASQASDVIADEMTKILEDAGLKGDEPEMKEWMKENEGKPWYESGRSFFDTAQSLKGKADSAPIGGGEGGATVPDDLTAAYTAARLEIYSRMTKGEITHYQAKAEADIVKAKAKEGGVPVDQIGFGGEGVRNYSE